MNQVQSQHLATEQKLQQRLTPLQVQFVRLLEMNEAEAADEVRRALDEMPALEAVDDAAPEPGVTGGIDGGSRLFAGAAALRDRDLARGARDDDDDRPDRGFPDEGPTLIEYLETQLAQTEEITPDQRLIGRYVIGNIDGNGYLTRSLQAIADDITIAEGHDVTAGEVGRVLDVIKGFDPAGVGATSLRECLMLQLQRGRRDVTSVTALTILRDQFDLFAKKHFDRIANILGITPENMRDAVETIGRLNPKPGASFASGAHEVTRHIVPDFEVEPDDEGRVTVRMPNDIPELRVEQSFTEEAEIPAASSRGAADARYFIKRNRQDAQNFIRVISMRRETLYRVMSAIVKIQHRFFVTGDESTIRPMVLRDIAALTGYDISVISRATQEKYVATPTGLYPLKFFFNEASRGADPDLTHHRLVAEIRKLVDAEDKRSPLSDEALTAALREGGLDVARRTVAKYRERLGIPVARLRRETLAGKQNS